jgi:hypothetical protein
MVGAAVMAECNVVEARLVEVGGLAPGAELFH